MKNYPSPQIMKSLIDDYEDIYKGEIQHIKHILSVPSECKRFEYLHTRRDLQYYQLLFDRYQGEEPDVHTLKIHYLDDNRGLFCSMANYILRKCVNL